MKEEVGRKRIGCLKLAIYFHEFRSDEEWRDPPLGKQKEVSKFENG